MNWLTLSIVSVLSLAVSNLLRKILLRDDDSDVITYSFVFQMLCAVLVGGFAFVYGFVPPPIAQIPFNFILTAIFYGVGTLLLFQAYKVSEVSRVTILGSSSALWVIAAALIFLGESFSISKVIGVALILAGVVVVTLKKEAFGFGKGDLYALGSAMCYGLGFANDAFILRMSNALSYTPIAFLLPGLLILALKPKLVKNLKQFLKARVLTKMSAFAVFYSVSAVAVYLAYQNGGDAAQLGPISQLSVILTIVLATIFLGERKSMVKKGIAAILATIGVILLRQLQSSILFKV